MKPYLVLPRGRLRPIAAEDLEDFERLLHRAEVKRFLCDDQVLGRHDVSSILKENLLLDRNGLGLWVIELEQCKFAGVVGLAPVTPVLAQSSIMREQIEVTVALHSELFGQGVAFNALSQIINHAKLGLNLSKVVAAVDLPNTRSHRLLDRAGFISHGQIDGPANPLILYVLELNGKNEKRDSWIV